eukprot:scaffold372109_cov83-Cyclotella_meneghiniana.AAC.1
MKKNKIPPLSSGQECEHEEECFDITQNQFPTRRSGSLSTGLPPLNVAPSDVKKGKKSQDLLSEQRLEVECDEEVEECFDITQSRFPDRTESLSTGISPTNVGADVSVGRKKQSIKRGDEVESKLPNVKSQEECEEGDDECFDITQSRFPARTKSLSTGLPPSNSHHNDASKEVKDFLPPRHTKDHYDITQNLFPEGRRATSTFSNLASGKVMQTNNGAGGGDFKSDQYQKTAAFDITQNLFPEKPGQTLSAFDATEKSEMNSRPPPQFMDGSSYVLDINKRQISKDRSLLPLSVNTGTVKSKKAAIEFESSDDYVDITKQHFQSDRSTFTQLVNSGTKKDGTTYGSWDESRLITMPERTKDASWRFRRSSNNVYLDKPQFSPDLSPPSFGKPGLPESRYQQISGTVNIEPKQRFNTSEANYRDVVATSDRRPLSETANAAVEKRFNTSAEVYRDAFVSVERPPLSSTVNAIPNQRFNTIDDSYKDPQSSSDRRILSSIAHTPSQQRFITSEQGYRDNSVLSGRQPFNVNAAPEPRFKTKEQRRSDSSDGFFSSSFATDNAQPLSLTIHSSNSRFNTVTRKTLFTTNKTTDGTENEVAGIDVPPAFNKSIEMVTISSRKTTTSDASSSSNTTNLSNTLRASINAEPPLSQTIHSVSDRFNITRKSSSSFATQTVGFDMPRAFIKNIDMVTTSKAKNGKNTADEIKFSPNLSSSTTVKDLTKQTHNESSQELNPDDNQFSSILSESTTIRDVRRTQQGLQNEDAPLVDENRFSPDLTRVSNAKHKPGSNLKSTPHMPLDEGTGIDLNYFSEISDLCPPSKLRNSGPNTQTKMEESVDQLLDLSSRKTVNTATKADRSASASLSQDPFVDVPRFSQPETLMGPLRVKNLTAPPIESDDLGVDLVKFSPTSKLRPPSQVRYIQRKSADKKSQPRAPHINPYFYQLSVGQSNRNQQQKKISEYVSVDQFLDLSSQHTVNNSSMTALGQHAIMSNDPYVDITVFSNPESFSPPSKVKTYVPIEDEYFDITQSSPNGSLTRNVSSVRDAIAATKKRVNSNQNPNSLLRNVSSVRDAISASNVRKEGELDNIHMEKFESPEDEVRHWLLLRLPYLNEESIVAYTEKLIEDGFDSNEMLGELIEEDVSFMKDCDMELLVFFMDLKYWFLAHLPQLEESYITQYSRQLIDDGFDSFEMIDELKRDDLNFMKSAHRRAFDMQFPEQNEDEEASFDITRDPFRQERPSLASDPNHYSITSAKKEKAEKPTVDDTEESFDITRASFPARPSLATAAQVEDSEYHEQSVTEPDVAAGSASPKAELYQFYIEKGLNQKQASDINNFYTVLENNASSHDKKFTSIFTCPITGEHFLAGHWKEGGEVLSVGHAYWYSESSISLM